MVSLQNRIKEKIKEISDSADEYPGAVIIHDVQESKIAFMCDRGLREINQRWEDIKNLSIEEYHQKFFNPEDAKEYIPKLEEMLLKKDPDKIISFFQQVRTVENQEWEWYFSSMKILMFDDDQQPLLTLSFAIPIDPKNHVTNKVNRLLEENNFLREHHEKFYSLGKREKEVLKLIALGKSNGEMAHELTISEKTIETHRKNLKRKLNIKSPFDLQQYARAFDLI